MSYDKHSSSCYLYFALLFRFVLFFFFSPFSHRAFQKAFRRNFISRNTADVFGETFGVSVSFHLPPPPEYDVDNRSPTNRLPFRRNSWKIRDAFAARKSVRATKLFRMLTLVHEILEIRRTCGLRGILDDSRGRCSLRVPRPGDDIGSGESYTESARKERRARKGWNSVCRLAVRQQRASR